VRRVATFWRLSATDRRLLLQAAATLAVCQLALRFFDFQRLRRWAGRVRSGSGSVERITWATRTAARSMPCVTCLGMAIALQRLLGLHGHASELKIGVAKTGQEVTAHAWLVVEGRTLIGEDNLDQYTQLA